MCVDLFSLGLSLSRRLGLFGGGSGGLNDWCGGGLLGGRSRGFSRSGGLRDDRSGHFGGGGSSGFFGDRSSRSVGCANDQSSVTSFEVPIKIPIQPSQLPH